MHTTLTQVHETELSELDQSREFLQTSLWGGFKQKSGWKAQAFSARWQTPEGIEVTPFLVLSRQVAGPFRLAYIPFGPALDFIHPPEDAGPLLRQLGKKLASFLKGSLLCVRWDLPFPFAAPPKKLPPLKRGATVQPPDTVWIDLSKPEEKLLEEMERGHRYNVGYAERKGVVITEGGPDSVGRWFEIFRTTASRDGFAGHGQEYYQLLAETAAAYQGPGNLGLRYFFAEHEGDTLAGTIVSISNSTATYLYSASSNAKRNLKPVYLMLWRVMQAVKAVGCTRLDMFGIPPDGNPKHHLAGLYDFKRYFGGEIIHRGGSWDVPLSPLYPIFRWVEYLRTPKSR